MSDDAHQAYLRGDFAQAAALLRPATVPDRKRLALYLFAGGRLPEAAALLRETRSLAPEDAEIPENIGVILGQMGDPAGAITAYREAHALAPERANVCDGLAHSLSLVGGVEEGRRFGCRALELKDAEAAASPVRWPVPGTPPPAFDPENRPGNVIAFSLWGQDPRYTGGAIRNALIARDLFPLWICRFYHDDTVPARVVRQLRALGSETIRRPRPESFFEGLLWRFAVIGDPAVGRFLIRDADAVLNTRERVAVDAWLASGRWFHAMRDYPSHTEVLLAGMWGGVQGVLPPLAELRDQFRPRVAPTRTFDQLFLREAVWPTVRQSVLIHDSVYTGCLGSVPFPPGGELPAGWHVGQNESAIHSRPSLPPPAAPLGEGCRFLLAGTDAASVDETRALLNASPAAHCGAPLNLASLVQKSAALAREAAPGADCAAFTGRLLAEALDFAAEPPPDRPGATGGVALDGSLEPVAPLMRALPEACLLFLIRDPRSIAAESGRDEAEVAQAWAGDLDAVRRLAQTFPGRVEIARIEDLHAREAGAAVRRQFARCLGIGAGDFGPARGGGPRPSREDGPIPAAGGSADWWMDRLHYLHKLAGVGLPA